MTNQIHRSIIIDANPEYIWKALTQAEAMQQWMGEPEMNIEIQTDWQKNSSIIIRL